MTAATIDRNTRYSLGDLLSLLMEGATRIFSGTIVCVNSAGYAVPGADTAGYVFMGIAEEQCDNRLGLCGAARVTVRRRGFYDFDYQGLLTQPAIGSIVCAVDDSMVDSADDTTNDIEVGQIVGINSARSARISIDCAAMKGDAWLEPTTTTAAATTTTTGPG